MWHGASWNFILWGLYYLVFQILEKLVLNRVLERTPKVLRHIYLLVVVYFGWMLFKFTDMSQLGIALKGLFALNGNGFTDVSVGLALKNNIFFLAFATIAVTPLGVHLRNILKNLSRKNVVFFWIDAVWEIAHPVLLLLVSAMALAGNSYNPFLYFQF